MRDRQTGDVKHHSPPENLTEIESPADWSVSGAGDSMPVKNEQCVVIISDVTFEVKLKKPLVLDLSYHLVRTHRKVSL